ncbi:hypothetical protein BH18ACT10_BH18ACT10_13530 [soil metagenome]
MPGGMGERIVLVPGSPGFRIAAWPSWWPIGLRDVSVARPSDGGKFDHKNPR